VLVGATLSEDFLRDIVIEKKLIWLVTHWPDNDNRRLLLLEVDTEADQKNKSQLVSHKSTIDMYEADRPSQILLRRIWHLSLLISGNVKEKEIHTRTADFHLQFQENVSVDLNWLRTSV